VSEQPQPAATDDAAREAPAPVQTVVHLVRHGEVDNPDKILYGRLPGYHLSGLGRQMADAVAAHFAGHDVTHVVSSPLERAQETAAPVAAALGLPVETDERLIEADNHFEGLAFGVGDGSLRHPRHWKHLANPLRPSWGEPYRQVVARMLAAVHGARAEAAGHEAVLVSHQLPVWATRRYLEGRRLWHDPRRRECSLASITSLHFAGRDLVAISYAEPAAALLPTASTVPGA
jgi:broad specificity phosphatase PhoE